MINIILIKIIQMIVEHYRLEFKIVYRLNKNAKSG